MYTTTYVLCPITETFRYMLLLDGTRIDSFDDRESAELFVRIYSKK